MVVLLFTWVAVFIIIYLVGFSVTELLSKTTNEKLPFETDEIYFSGFVLISILASYFSIVIPLNYSSLIGLVIGAIAIFFRWRKELKLKISGFVIHIKNLRLIDTVFLLFIIIFITVISSYGIQNYDTELYHTQAVKWMREFAIVPGLANLHGRLGYNSMFFPISSIFTIDTTSYSNLSSLLIYPLNSVSLLVLLLKEYFNIKKNVLLSDWKKVITDITLVYLCLFFLSKPSSSLSPDVISVVLIIYLFQMGLKYNWEDIADSRLLLFVSLVFLAFTYKLSSVLLVFIIIPVIVKKNFLQKTGIIALIGVVIITPFLIRNYYLSGYLIYPFPAIDIFNVDWKVPIDSVVNDSDFIKSWARIPEKNPKEVLGLTINQWFFPWFERQEDVIKIILIGNASTVFYMVYYAFKKQYHFVILYVLLLINLLYWFLQAPDPRFVYGFLFLGFAFFLSDFLTVTMGKIKSLNKLLSNRFIIITICVSAITLICVKLSDPLVLSGLDESVMAAKMKYSDYLIFPKKVKPTETKIYKISNSVIYTPVNKDDDRCFNSPIPNAPYFCLNPKLALRKSTLKDGFKIER